MARWTTPKKNNPETQIKKACLQYLKVKYGQRFYFVNIIGGLGIRPGTPDTLACLNGRFIAIEFKNGDMGRVTDYQEQALFDINQAGGIGVVIRSVDQCIEFFKEISGIQGELF